MARELKSCQFHALSYAVYGRTYSLPSPHQEETVSFLFFVPEIILWRLAPMIIIIYFVKSQHDYYFDNHHQLLVRDSLEPGPLSWGLEGIACAFVKIPRKLGIKSA